METENTSLLPTSPPSLVAAASVNFIGGSGSSLMELYESGMSLRAVGEAVGCSSVTVWNRLKQAGVTPRSCREAVELTILRGNHNRKPFPPQGFGEENNNWRGGRYVSRGGYCLIYQPDKQGYTPEHRLVWEEANGRRLPDGWVVHHLNGVRTDNRPENLVAMSRSKHGRIELGEAYKNKIRELEEKIKALEADRV